MITKLEKIKAKYGEFEYKEIGGGFIKIEDSWVKSNIISLNLPIIGMVKCHKDIAWALSRVFSHIEYSGDDITLIDINDTKKNGGCWVARHQLFDTNKPLSYHSWGIAIDINPTTNGYGKEPTPEMILLSRYFKDVGFDFGGDWQTPDGMHMEIKI